jgi:hypothetical protein
MTNAIKYLFLIGSQHFRAMMDKFENIMQVVSGGGEPFSDADLDFTLVPVAGRWSDARQMEGDQRVYLRIRILPGGLQVSFTL